MIFPNSDCQKFCKDLTLLLYGFDIAAIYWQCIAANIIFSGMSENLNFHGIWFLGNFVINVLGVVLLTIKEQLC
jgi:hypothetical protein